MSKFALGLTLPFLLMFAACSAERQRVVTRTEVVRVIVPAHLTEPTPEPECLIEVNGDFVPCIQALREALGLANADKAAIRQSFGNKP